MDLEFNSAMLAHWSETYENAAQTKRFSGTLHIHHARVYCAELSRYSFA